MALDVRHRKIDPVADGPDANKVRPSDWNASHKIELNDGKVVGRFAGSGPGEAVELPIRVKSTGDVDMNSSSFTKVASGTTAQRPGAPDLGPGALRHNTTTDRFEGAGSAPAPGDEQWHVFLDERGGTLTGPLNEGMGEDVASSATPDLTDDGNLLHISGNVQINGFVLPEGAERVVIFDGTPKLNSSDTFLLPVPTGEDITAEAGDVAFVRGLPDAKSMVTAYARKSGEPLRVPSGVNMVVQTLRVQDNNHTDDLNKTFPYDNTTPQSGSGTNNGHVILTQAITLKHEGSKVRIRATVNAAGATPGVCCAALFVNGTSDALACQFWPITADVTPTFVEGEHEPASGLGPFTYSCRLGMTTAILFAVNGTQGVGADRRGGGKLIMSLLLEEIAQ